MDDDDKVNAGEADSPPRASTGIPGLDEVLLGGFLAENVYLIQGNPGSGKTTLGMQFLIEGVKHGETGLYVTLSESEKDIQAIAKSHGWSLDGITLYVEAASAQVKAEEEYTVFPADEIELLETTDRLYEEAERIQPRRVVVDSLAELRLMAKDPRRYRRQILSLKQFFSQRMCTVLLLDDQSAHDPDLQLQTVAHSVIELERVDQQYGVPRLQLSVIKVRGSKFHGGPHDYIIQRGGLVVFPRLVAAEDGRGGWSAECLPSGLVELDALLGGGLCRGTSALLLGPPGAGKSALVMQYAFSRMEQGEAVACFVFEESRERVLDRAAGFGWDLRRHVDAGRLTVR
jgi:circadian clock protein KaiC